MDAIDVFADPSRFKVGDQVKITSPKWSEHGKTGTVSAVRPGFVYPLLVEITAEFPELSGTHEFPAMCHELEVLP